MDAVEFLVERKRMCDSFSAGICEDCPLFDDVDGCGVFMKTPKFKPEDLLSIVEKWSKEHPRKTRLTDFLEKYPNATMGDDGLPRSCARFLGYTKLCPGGCCRCWNTPLEDTK